MASMKCNDIYINKYYTLAGVLEGKGKIKNYDYILKEPYYGEATAEKAEMKMQRQAVEYVVGTEKVDYLLGGDLSDQIAFSSMTASKYDIPFIGLYSACATFTLELANASLLLSTGSKKAVIFTSSHNLNSEKQFRFPIEYGCPKPDYSTFTATGAVAALISKEKSNIKVNSFTVGKVIDMGINDAYNMGAVMAPAAADTIYRHLKDFNIDVNYYDLILTGDLGEIGSIILKRIMKEDYGINLKNHVDAGTLIYEDKQKTFSGASGPAALPLVLFTKIIKNKKYKKILIVGTGSLHSKTLVNQKNIIPSIAHAVSLEVS